MSDVVDRVRSFVEEHGMAAERELLRRGFRDAEPVLAALRAKVLAAGLWAPQLPRAYGGLGLTLREFAPVSEELGRCLAGHYAFNCQAPDVGNMELLLSHGTDAQKAAWLEPLARGEIRSCFAMTEPGHAGSNPVWMSTTASRDGGDYVIDGHKWFVSSADGAAFAIVMAVTDPDADPHRRATQIVVPCDTPGYSLVRNLPVMGETGAGWLSHGEVRLEGCRVPQSNRLGEQGDGFALAQARLGPGRIHHCMRWIGICERAFEMMCRRALARQLAPGQKLAAQQAVQHWIAESRADIDAARLLVLDATDRLDRGERARLEIALIKFHVAGVLGRVLDRAVQVHGAFGLTDDTPLAWWYRHERAARIYDGPDEVHKNYAARLILKAWER